MWQRWECTRLPPGTCEFDPRHSLQLGRPVFTLNRYGQRDLPPFRGLHDKIVLHDPAVILRSCPVLRDKPRHQRKYLHGDCVHHPGPETTPCRVFPPMGPNYPDVHHSKRCHSCAISDNVRHRNATTPAKIVVETKLIWGYAA